LQIAYAYFLVYAPRADRSVFFGRFISALMILTSHLFTTYRLYETNARGVRLNHQVVFKYLLLSGYNEEIDAMCQRTRRWVETRDTRSTDNLLFFDSAFIASNAFLHFAFPHQILKTTIKSEYALDAVHLMLARQYGAYLIAFAFVSVLAVHFTLKNQRIYVLSRIIMQMSMVVLNVLGHWSDSVYHTQHIIPFMISAFYITFLISLFYRLQRIDDRAWNGEKITITRRMKSPSMEGRHEKKV
uniref:Uncharacterized protein n=1 Tax=Anisakis simplex TaxID=6269 RepID=A0A0M3J2H2_ANISI